MIFFVHNQLHFLVQLLKLKHMLLLLAVHSTLQTSDFVIPEICKFAQTT